MLPQLWTSVLLIGFAALTVSESPPGLIDALIASGASRFAELIQSDSQISGLYFSDQVGTVFAPSDLYIGNVTLGERSASPEQIRAASFQCAQQTTSTGLASRMRPGSTIETNDKRVLLNNRGQKVVVDARPRNLTNPTRRWASSSIAIRQDNETEPILRISAGLGQITNVIKGDIPYDGGLIHITDSYFKTPESLSSTSQVTGQTAFANLLSSSNTSKTLDTTPSVTVFLPLNAAINNANSSLPPSQLISDHVVAGTVSYLPDLKDGTVLTTQRGELLAISVRSGRYYVNGGLITQANLILENGVAHVVNKVLKPTPAPVTGAASSPFIGLTDLLMVVGSVGMMTLV
ncbi:FAS1 domain-containing protein [Hypomontagnella monticulosa]|nr:FAS1 domain-containing protein [Hypomontagnella monticulosa]